MGAGVPDQYGESEGGREQLLLVDDHLNSLSHLIAALQKRGYGVHFAETGEEALKIARETRPCLILLDIIMPGMDGHEVCRQLKADRETSGIAVIFVSALDDEKDLLKGFKLGAVDYITKPFQVPEVMARVDAHLKIRRLEQCLSNNNKQLEAMNRRMKRDLEAATRVQQALLPSVIPAISQAKTAWAFRPCDELAGDALNIHQLDESHYSLYVVDVSGHGVPAALLSVTVTRSLMPHPDRACVLRAYDNGDESVSVVDPADVARRLNVMYPMQQNAMLYFTLVYGVLNTRTGSFRFVTAGHPGPIHVNSELTTRILDSPQVPIGVLDDADFKTTEIYVRPGERIYLYSDGLYEQRNAEGELFGRDRLCRTISESYASPLGESVDQLLHSAVSWPDHEHFSDDVSVLAFEIDA